MSSSKLPEVSMLSLERTAELFGVLSTPVRLQIIRALCDGEKNVTHLLAQIEASQPNMSRHLQVLYQSGLLTRRRSGHQIFYCLAEAPKALVCKLVCMQLARDEQVFDIPV
ncbi:metalloregulator ArsR/SmtB family transcription factor [Rhodoferax sp.]|uniref:ArsR/SmtB family transcription factor n=1 Tax=Rhodoferax sp. TaxID=50421 RepID=UPI0025D50EA7|nr:metalloregulator ArsR/SmtB family transcription factor [Rhodoferax sp.]